MKKILIIAAKMAFIVANGLVMMFALMLLDNAPVNELYDLVLFGLLLPIGLLLFVQLKWGYKDVSDFLNKISEDDDL